MSIIRDQFRPRPWRKYMRPQPAETCRVDWASGACLLLRREAFNAVGGFDEKFFLYVEEVDLQKRLHDAGRETWYVPAATMMHHASHASGPAQPEVLRHSARGTLRYFAKHAGFFTLMGYRKMAFLSGRLGWRDACRSRRHILQRVFDRL
jgi:N-acetylglucosaminyl-diphospho-decaprenol L-rhamnosyltransferase